MRLARLSLLLLWACKGDKEPIDTGAPVDPGPFEITDVFDQELTSPVDILWVLDSSWQEGNDQLDTELLKNSFETLLLADPNWRIGILDPAARGLNFGQIRDRFETWPFPQSVFNLPNLGGSTRIRDAVYTALDLRKETRANKDFIRSDAHLYVLVYTDETDASEDLDQEAFLQWLRDFQPSNSKRLSVLTTARVADYWRDRTLDGVVFESDGGFRKAVEAALRDAMNQRTAFTLTYTPTAPPGTVSVVYREHATEYALDLDYSWSEETRTISFFDVVPPPGSEIVVSYTTEDEPVEATPSTTDEE